MEIIFLIMEIHGKNHGIVFLNFCGNSVSIYSPLFYAFAHRSCIFTHIIMPLLTELSYVFTHIIMPLLTELSYVFTHIIMPLLTELSYVFTLNILTLFCIYAKMPV